MGTFRARFTLFSTSGNTFSTAGAGDDAFHFYQNAVKSGTINFSLLGDCYYLDGSATPVSFSGLPSGFTLSGLQTLTTPSIALGGVTIIGSRGAAAPGKSTILLTYGSYTKSIVFPTSQLIVSDLTITTLLDITNSLQIDCATLSAVASIVQIIDTIDINGSYVITNYPITPTIDSPTTGVVVGDRIEISAPEGLDGVETIELSYTDPILGAITIDVPRYFWIIINPTTLWFYLPFGFGTFSGTVTITLIGNDIQFSGSVPAGTISILFADASGIYSLTPGQTDDILYSREGYTTTNRKIMLPNMDEAETFVDDFFLPLGYPYAILSQNDLDEDYEISNFSMIGTQQIVTVTTDNVIPSPFVKLAFLP